jgi:hypothetical protein
MKVYYGKLVAYLLQGNSTVVKAQPRSPQPTQTHRSSQASVSGPWLKLSSYCTLHQTSYCPMCFLLQRYECTNKLPKQHLESCFGDYL